MYKSIKEALDELPLLRASEVERVSFNQAIESPPAIHYKDETTDYPLVRKDLF